MMGEQMKLRPRRLVAHGLRSILCALSLASCTITIDHGIPLYTVGNYPQHQKIGLKVALQLSDELRQTKWQRKALDGTTWVIPLGEHLAHNAESVAKKLLSEVVVMQRVTPDASQDRVDAILTPKVLYVQQTYPMSGGSGVVLAIAIEWTLKSLDGETVWVDTVNGEGRSSAGNAFTMGARAQERTRAIMDDLFQKSFEAIASAQAIKEFAGRRNRGADLGGPGT
jgi:hypothetical protein